MIYKIICFQGPLYIIAYLFLVNHLFPCIHISSIIVPQFAILNFMWYSEALTVLE